MIPPHFFVRFQQIHQQKINAAVRRWPQQDGGDVQRQPFPFFGEQTTHGFTGDKQHHAREDHAESPINGRVTLQFANGAIVGQVPGQKIDRAFFGVGRLLFAVFFTIFFGRGFGRQIFWSGQPKSYVAGEVFNRTELPIIKPKR